MKLRKFLCALLTAIFAVQMLSIAAFADEGMWPINNVPKAEIKRKYGFEVTDAWLKKVQMSAVRFNSGGSGSFVSPNGLVLTNYHIVEDFVGELSTPQKDYAKEGFVARARPGERRGRHRPRECISQAGDVDFGCILRTARCDKRYRR
jgi:S1-C subfamily serine protease